MVALLAVALALVLPVAATALGAGFDNPTSHDTSQKFTPPPDPTNPQRQDKPNDPEYDQAEPDGNTPHSTNFYDERYDLFGFPSALTTTARYYDGPNAGPVPGARQQVAGYNAVGAWKLTRGRPDVVIAILDTGIRWNNAGLRKRIHLNRAELPVPKPCSTNYDCNGDGQFNVDDYKNDPSVTTHTGPGGTVTGQDLIKAFSNSTDSDANGYVDDIAGWDFFDNDNDPNDASSYFAAGNHGSGRASDAAEEGNDGTGTLGVCPRCQIMPLRTWDTFVSDGNSFAQGIIYAADNKASVVEGANGSLYHSAFAERASQYAYDKGLVQTFSGDDLNTANHNYPSNYGHAMLIEGTVPDSKGLGMACPAEAGPLCDVFTLNNVVVGTNAPVETFFRNANTTQFGGKSSLSMEGATGSVNTGRASGGAGLVVSAGLANGITLRPDEVRSIMEQTAEDVTQGNTAGTGAPDPAVPGWDSHFGWGRANLGAAVSAASSMATVPPEASIDSPDWYAPLSGKTLAVKGRARSRFTSDQVKYKLEWGAGQSPTTWHTVTDTPAAVAGPVTDFGSIDLDVVRAELNSFTVPPDPAGPIFSPTGKSPFQQEFTVRLTVTAAGAGRVKGVDRRIFNALDPAAEGLRSGFPKRLGTGGEAPIRYADLNGDNDQELIVPAEDGTVHAYRPDGSELPGWPVHTQIQQSINGHASAPGIAAVTGQGAPPREPPRGAAIADIDGDGKPEVIDTAGIHLYVWEADGSVRSGFPVTSNLGFCGPGPQFQRQDDRHAKCGFLASPAVADLDGDGRRTDIVVAALDGHLYAFTANGGTVPNFPRQLVDPVKKTAGEEVVAESISQVAVGDLNGDGTDDIVSGSNETYGTAPSNGQDVSFGGLLGAAGGKSTRVYAVNGKTGTILPGWPIAISGLIPDVLPLIGPGADPSILKVGGQPKVVASATSGSLATYDTDGTLDQTMKQEDTEQGNAVDKSPGLNLFESAAIGRLRDADADAPSIVKYQVSLAQAANLLLVGQNFPYNHEIGAWDPATGVSQPGFPTITDDYQFLSSSTVAKVHPGGATNQVVAGTGLGLVHAYDGLTGQDVPGFPKTTGGWLFAPAELSDDGRMAGITREGYLFEWTSDAPACQKEWPTFRHDPQQSGNYNRDGTAPAAPGNVSLVALGGGKYRLSFKSPGDDRFCGSPASYRAFAGGSPVEGLGPVVAGGTQVTRDVTLAPGTLLTFQAVDEEGNRGYPAELAVPADVAPGGGDTPGGGGPAPGGAPPGGGPPVNPPVVLPPGCPAAGAKVPRSSISRRHLRATKRRLSLQGRSIEVDCATGKLAAGRVKRVLVTVARLQGRRCRFLRRSGRLASVRPCSKPQRLAARVRFVRRGDHKTVWSLKLKVRLPRGRYLTTVRGVDTRKHLETISRPTNTKTFRIR